GTRRALGAQRAARAELDRDPAGAEVRDDRGDRERIDPIRTALTQLGVTVLKRLQPADPRRDRGPDSIGLPGYVDARVLFRLPGSGDHHLGEPVHSPRSLVLDPLGGIEVLQLAGEADEVAARVELGDRAGAGHPGYEVLPRRPRVVAEGRHRPHARDHDPATPVDAHRLILSR